MYLTKVRFEDVSRKLAVILAERANKGFTDAETMTTIGADFFNKP